MIRAVIDIGSNSIKLRVAKIEHGHAQTIRDETEVVRLGRAMSESGLLSDESMKLSCNTIARMIQRASQMGAEIFIAGTMALRTAKNSYEFVKMVKEATGHDIHILSGEDEAKYSWIGAVEGLDIEGDAVMFDSGGGSTEFVLGSEGKIKKVISIPVGAVNLSEKFFADKNNPIKKSSCDSAISYVNNVFAENNLHEFMTSSHQVIGVGGGAVTMASVKYACENFTPSRLHKSILTQNDILRQINMYASLTLKERENVIGLPASRADVILGSACIILAALRILDAPSFTVSINGLRHGLLVRAV